LKREPYALASGVAVKAPDALLVIPLFYGPCRWRLHLAIAIAQGVVFLDRASILGVEQLVGVLRGTEESNAREIDTESIDGLHTQSGMDGRVVVLFDPVGELPIQRLKRTEIKIANEELVANSAKEAFDLPLGSRVSNGRVTQNATHSGTDERNFL